jgi:sugar/nucleoside kinase (ribokinase family)
MNGLFWGLLTIDMHFFADHFPEENSKTKVKEFDSYIGGPATNAAITFQHLGGNSQLVTAIGQNSFRSMIYYRIRQFSLETIDMKEEEETDPIFASILTNESSGSRTIFSYTPSGLKTTIIPERDNLYDIALFDGFYIESAITRAAKCREQGITTVMDGGSWKKGTEKLLPYIDIAICSQDFIPPGIVNQEDVTAYLLKKGVKKAAITRGEKSIIANEGEVNLLVEVPKVDVIDTLGAGDIFHGAFCYYYIKYRDFRKSLKKAAEVAASSCRFRGPRTWMRQA